MLFCIVGSEYKITAKSYNLKRLEGNGGVVSDDNYHTCLKILASEFHSNTSYIMIESQLQGIHMTKFEVKYLPSPHPD